MSSENKNKLLGSDLMLTETALGSDLAVSENGEVVVASEEVNLAQSILHRLRTAKGELADIGHPNYGSTIFNFVGQPNNEIVRARLKMTIRETLAQEPRIKEIKSIAVKSRLPSKEKAKEIERPKVTVELSKFSEGQVSRSAGPSQDFSSSVDVKPSSIDILNAVDVEISIIPIGKNVPLNIVFPFYLEVSG